MISYRKIWIASNGPIPFDEHGRRYEIHHINGIHSDNRLENLLCVSIQEHYDIHLRQGDLQAAAAIARRMMVPAEKQKYLNRLAGQQAFERKSGFHGLSRSENSRNGRKGALAHIGKTWWTDGVKNTRSIESPGPNWRSGRTVQGTGVRKGTILGGFWNNGIINKRSLSCPGPEWTKGKLLNSEQKRRRSQIATNTMKRRWSKSCES